MRVAVIGRGSIGRRHARNLWALGCQVVTWDIADGPDSPYETVGGVVDCAEPDALVIATPYDAHLEAVEVAIRKSVPFYVEKPLGSLEQLPCWRELVKASEGLTTQVGYQLRFHPRYRAMRQLVPEPTGGLFKCDFDMSTWPGKAYGPPELEASHELDLALDCGLSPETVVLGNNCARYRRSWFIQDKDAVASAQFWSAEELGDQMYVDAMAHFLECVREGKQTMVPLSDGLRVLEALCPS